MMKKVRLSELRLGNEIIAVSDSPNQLFHLKAKMIFNRDVRYADSLQVFFEGLYRWIFDRDLTRKEASKIIADEGFFV